MNRPWFPLYVSDYLVNNSELSPVEHGVFMLLLMHCWRLGGELPNDIQKLYRLCRATNQYEKKAVEKIVGSRFLTTENNMWLTSKRLSEELAKSLKVSDSRRANAQQMLSKRSANQPANADTVTVTKRITPIVPLESQDLKPTSKPKKSKTDPRENKLEVAPMVWISPEEKSRLESEFGSGPMEWMFKKLSSYKQSSGKEYVSDNGAIRTWVIEDWIKKGKPSSVASHKPWHDGNGTFDFSFFMSADIKAMVIDKDTFPDSSLNKLKRLPTAPPECVEKAERIITRRLQ